jgi:hypothetical protein
MVGEDQVMFEQLFIGSIVTLASLVTAAVFWWLLNELLDSMERWIRRPPHAFKSFIVILMVVNTTMLMMSLGVWLWAVVFLQMGIFETLEEAVYYSLVAYTTLGLGDVVVPAESRLLGGMTGANGFLMFGLMTAMLTDTLRHIRKVQRYIRD